MAPLVPAYHPKDLQTLVQTRLNNKPHKPPFNLKKDCELKEMVQYFCDLDGPKEDPRSKVVCEPCLRLFRVCKNGVTVETTSWEGVYDGSLEMDSEKDGMK